MEKFIFAMLAFVPVGAAGHDCRKGADTAVIEKTRAMVLVQARLRPTVGEFPAPSGTTECVRFAFSISPRGRAINVEVSDSSENVAFEMAALDALLGYRFRSPVPGFAARYTLVFEDVDNKIPPGYFGKQGGGGR